MEANRVYLELHSFKKVLDLLKKVKEKITLGTVEIIDVLTDINTIYSLLANTKVEEE